MDDNEVLEGYAVKNNFEVVGGNFVTHIFDTLADINGSVGTYSLKVAVIRLHSNIPMVSVIS